MVWPTDFDSRLDYVNKIDATEVRGHQLRAAYASSLLDHTLNLDLKAEISCVRLTGIFAYMGYFDLVEIGKSTNDIEIMERMMAAGMNVAVLNFCFGTREEHIETIKMLQQAADNITMAKGKTYPLCIAARLSGKKIRTGKIADIYGDRIEIKADEIVRLTTDETYKERCSMYTIYVDYVNFADDIKKGDNILLDNESIMIKVEIISSTTVTCKVERGGFLGSYKDVFVPNVVFNMSNYSEKDKLDIQMAMRHQVDILIAPFVNTGSAVIELKNMLGVRGKKISIIAAIQTVEGFHNFDDILLVSNGVMISRQELGSDITPIKLIIAQKNMIAQANRANVPICISANILSSMRDHIIPLRSELLDVSNCILDGADGLVLSAETAVGMHPVETVATLAAVCKEAEPCLWSKQIYHDLIDKTPLPCDQATGAALGAVLAAQRSIASAFIVLTSTGKSAQLIAKFRPRCPIIAITRYAPIARQLHMWRAIVPILYEDNPDKDWQKDVEKRTSSGMKWAIERGFVKVGDPVVVVFGWQQGTGYTNSMRIIYATEFKSTSPQLDTQT